MIFSLMSKKLAQMTRLWAAAAFLLVISPAICGQTLSLQSLVTPSTVIRKDGVTVRFAVHGFIEFNSLADLFPYIETQTQRWPGSSSFDQTARRQLSRELLGRGIESRVISMLDERPLETLITHTRSELQQALADVKEPVPPGYAEAFLAVQEKWKHSLNCWSASPSIPGRVLSNWYPIEEGIHLYGETYDSTEHFWQSIKYHPDATVADVLELLDAMEKIDWTSWLQRLDGNPAMYLSNAYAVEFLRRNLARERLEWFRQELTRAKTSRDEHPRTIQQRGPAPFRFSAFEEKVLWGDLADLFHLVYTFSKPDDPFRKQLAKHHFDAIYFEGRRMGFISEEFRSLMLDIWRVKFLEMPRFREVILSIPVETRLSHFLNDGDSPDIPIPVYIEYLNRIREMARDAKQ
jgi:hypothetical protein